MLDDTIPIEEALALCEDDLAREKIAAARARVAAEFARLPPVAAALADDPGVYEIFVDYNGSFVVDRRRPSLADALDGTSSAPTPRGTPALAPWRRAKQDEKRITAAERARSMLDRIAAGGASVFVLPSLVAPALAGPFRGERMRGARLVTMKGEIVLRFPDGSTGWKPRVALPPAEPEAVPRRQASIWEIRETAGAVYAEARAAGRPAPNINEAEVLIRARCDASRSLIRPVLMEPEFDALRGRPGVRRT